MDNYWFVQEIPDSAPDATATVANINENWGDESPDEGIRDDGFAARYTQTMHFDAGEYTFIVGSDDGVRIFLDGESVLDLWTSHGAEHVFTADVDIAAGDHEVVVEYYELMGNAQIWFSYGNHPWTGSGTPEDPYMIYDCVGLQAIDGQSYFDNEVVKLANDIDCSAFSEAFAHADGGYAGFNPIDVFMGTFDGGGHTIRHLTISYPEENTIAFIKDLYGTVADVNFEDLHVVGGDNVAGIASSFSSGSVLNVRLDADSVILGSYSVGGIASQMGSGSNILQRVGVSATILGDTTVGGIVARQYARGPYISDAFFDGSILANDIVGGIIGSVYGDCGAPGVYRAYVAGSLTASEGIVGGIYGVIENTTCEAVEIFDALIISEQTGLVNGTFAGKMIDANLTATRVYVDETVTAPAGRTGGGEGSVVIAGAPIGVNGDGLSPEYFYNTATNGPFSFWDFEAVWQTIEGGLPTLRGGDEFGPIAAPDDAELTADGMNLESSWSVPVDDHGFEVFGYQIQLKRGDDAWEDLLANESPADPAYAFGHEDSAYDETFDIRVRAQTIYGYGLWAEDSYTFPSPPVHMIDTCEDLFAIDDLASGYADTYILTQSISCDGVVASSLGSDSWEDAFRGIFDGNSYVISDLLINQEGRDNVGLFSLVEGGTVKNLALDNVVVHGGNFTGGVVGYAVDSTLQNLTVSGEVSGAYYTGGIAGQSYDSLVLEDNEVSAVVSGDYYTGGMLGGILLEREGSVTLENNTFTGSFAFTDDDLMFLGGLVGEAVLFSDSSEEGLSLIIEENTVATDIEYPGQRVGGLIGYLEQEGESYTSSLLVSIVRNAFIGSISGTDIVGGILGMASVLQTSPMASLSFSMEDNLSRGGELLSDNGRLGGLIGLFGSSVRTEETFLVNISRNFSEVDIIVGEDTRHVGGLLGVFGSQGSISHNAFSGMLVSGGKDEEDGVVGLFGYVNENTEMEDNWYDSELAEVAKCFGRETDHLYGETLRGACEGREDGVEVWLEDSSVAPLNAWDFSTVWTRDSAVFSGAPYLRAQSVTQDPLRARTLPVQRGHRAVTLSGAVEGFSEESPTTWGFSYGTSEDYDEDVIYDEDFSGRNFSAAIVNFDCGDTYHYRSFFTYGEDVYVGRDRMFTAQRCRSDSSGSGGSSFGVSDDSDASVEEDENASPVNEEDGRIFQEEDLVRDADGRRRAPNSDILGMSPSTKEPELISLVQPGWFVRSFEYPTIYRIGEDGSRQVVWDTTTFFTWKQSWDDVIWVSDATLATLPLRGIVLPQPGKILLKIVSDPRVYALEEGDDGLMSIRWIPSEDVARDLYGERWSDMVVDYDPTLMRNFVRGDMLTSNDMVYPENMLSRNDLMQREMK